MFMYNFVNEFQTTSYCLQSLTILNGLKMNHYQNKIHIIFMLDNVLLDVFVGNEDA